MAGYLNDVNNVFLSQVTFGTTNVSSTAQVAIAPSIVSGSAVTSALLINPNFSSTPNTFYGQQITPAFNPSSGGIYPAAYGLSIASTIAPTGNGSVTNVYSLLVQGPTLSSGTATNAYSLYVTNASGAGSILNNYTAQFGSSTVLNPTVGIGTSTPSATLEVNGNINAMRVYQGGRTNNQQEVVLSTGYTQGGFGGGSVGTNIPMSANTTDFVTLTQSAYFVGGVFDGRYIYLAATNGNPLILRYDTTLPFTISSFTTFIMAAWYVGGAFDGRYVYFAPNYGTTSLARYDTSLSFHANSSYAFRDIGLAASAGALFDGRYIYVLGNDNASVTRYDTSASFTTSSSYLTYKIGVPPYYRGMVFDGRYIYFVPTSKSTSVSGAVKRYDTALSFTTAGSYASFDITTVTAGGKGFIGAVFDGRYVYFVPNETTYSLGNSGTITRYDTFGDFTDRNNYAFFNLKRLNSNCTGFAGGVFDGKYVYFVPLAVNGVNSGRVTRYDTTASFNSSNSYTVFNTATIDANNCGFWGAVFDGQYVYIVPWLNQNIVRMKAYSGPKAVAIAANRAPNGFVVGSFAAAPAVGDIIIAGSVGIGLSSFTLSYCLQLATDTARKIGPSDTWATGSDVRIKREIQDIPDALTTIRKLRPRKFQYHPLYAKNIQVDPESYFYGFIADEVEKVIDGCVCMHPSGFQITDKISGSVLDITNLKDLNAHNIFIYSVQAIKELADRNDSLQKQIDAL